MTVSGIGGDLKVIGVGTVVLKLTDNISTIHELMVHNVFYVPHGPLNLLSPQRLSQQDEKFGNKRKTFIFVL